MTTSGPRGDFRQRYDDVESKRIELIARLRELGRPAQAHPGYKRALKLLNDTFRKSKLAQRLAVLQAAAWLIDILERRHRRDLGLRGRGGSRPPAACRSYAGKQCRRARPNASQRPSAARRSEAFYEAKSVPNRASAQDNLWRRGDADSSLIGPD